MSDKDSNPEIKDEFNKSAATPFEYKKIAYQKDSARDKTSDKLESKHLSDTFNAANNLDENSKKPEHGKSTGSTQVKNTRLSPEGPKPPKHLKNAGASVSHSEASVKDDVESKNRNTEKSDLSFIEEARKNKENSGSKNKKLSDEFNSKSKK